MPKLNLTLRRFNDWFDRLPGERRFVYFMLSMALAIFPLQVGVALELHAWALFGFAWLAVMTFVAATRAASLNGRHWVAGAFMLTSLALIALAL